MSLMLVAPLAVADGWPKASNPAWEALISAASQEDPLVLMGDAVLGDAFAKRFQEDTGLPMLFITGGRSEGRTRFFREVQSGEPSIDVYLSGSSVIALARKNLLAPAKDMLILPEVTDGSNWREGAIHFVDSAARYLPVPSQYVSGKILVNTDLVDPTLLNTWDDLLAEVHRGKILFHDPSSSGAGDAMATFLAHVKGEEFLDDFFNGQAVAFNSNYRQITDSVARGVYSIGMGTLPSDIRKYQSEGVANLQVLSLSDHPGYLVGGSAVMSIPATAPNPNAAAVFANWYLSQRGQEAYANAMLVPSDRLDVTDGDWPEFLEPGTHSGYANLYSETWLEEIREPMRELVARVLAK